MAPIAPSPAAPPDDPREAAAQQIMDDILRDWMRSWRDKGVTLPPDDPLQKYWPADEPAA